MLLAGGGCCLLDAWGFCPALPCGRAMGHLVECTRRTLVLLLVAARGSGGSVRYLGCRPVLVHVFIAHCVFIPSSLCTCFVKVFADDLYVVMVSSQVTSTS